MISQPEGPETVKELSVVAAAAKALERLIDAPDVL